MWGEAKGFQYRDLCGSANEACPDLHVEVLGWQAFFWRVDWTWLPNAIYLKVSESNRGRTVTLKGFPRHLTGAPVLRNPKGLSPELAYSVESYRKAIDELDHRNDRLCRLYHGISKQQFLSRLQ